MIEILQYVTSDLWVFVGSTVFTCGVIISIGWAVNAMLIGVRGVKANAVF